MNEKEMEDKLFEGINAQIAAYGYAIDYTLQKLYST